MKKILTLFALALPSFFFAQGFAFGVKGGLSMATQKWDNSFERDPLFAHHVALFIESASDENFALWASGGWHRRGSAIRNRLFSTNGAASFVRKFEFDNASLAIGAKKRFPPLGEKIYSYYTIGLRGDYAVKNNLNRLATEVTACEVAFLPFDDGTTVRKLTAGAVLGIGSEVRFGELVGAIFELTVNPDFTNQYNQIALPGIILPPGCSFNGPGQNISIPQRKIRNTTVELSVGLRLLRKIEYVD